MGLFSLIKEAGEKLLGIGKAKAAEEAQVSADKKATANQAAANAIKVYVTKMGLEAENLEIGFDGKTATVSVAGIV